MKGNQPRGTRLNEGTRRTSVGLLVLLDELKKTEEKKLV